MGDRKREGGTERERLLGDFPGVIRSIPGAR